MTNSWLVVTPPLVVLVLAFITKKLNPSIITGIILASLIAMNGNILSTITLAATQVWAHVSDRDNLLLYTFLIQLGIIIALVIRTGGASAFTRFAASKIKNQKNAETTSLLFSLSLFIDDYLSNTTVGYVMRPLTDKFKIARVKLAFLVHSIATPLIIIMPISSWNAMLASRLRGAGITALDSTQTIVAADSLSVYIKTIPFIFYSFFMLASVFFIVRRRISFGPMAHHEAIALTTGNVCGGTIDEADTLENKAQAQGSLADLFVPLAILVVSIFIGLFTTTDSFLALFCAALFAMTTSIFFALSRKKISFSCLLPLAREGFDLMIGSIILLALASILGTIVKENLHTGDYLASLLMGNLSLTLVPFMLFVVSTCISIALGTSWGTMAIMIPIAVPMVTALSQVSVPTTLAALPLLLPALGAVFSGAICGDHISPVSQTTIMAARSSGANPLDHATTQIPYALPAVACTGIAFLLSGLLLHVSLLINSAISLTAGLILCISVLWLASKVTKH
jgi:tetracycline resistance efflux pump